MNPIANQPGVAVSGYPNLLESTNGVTSKHDTQAGHSNTSSTARSSATDQATFSSLALQLSQTSSTAAALFAGRPGMSTSALSLATANPGLATSSKGLSFADVATDARARLDDKYAQMRASGAAYDASSSRDTYSLLGDLDRRSLYAVSSNKDGLFTAAEQSLATDTMRYQQGIAMGLYENGASAAFTANPARTYKAGLDFLENVSAEEKGSAEWLQQHSLLAAGANRSVQEEKPQQLLNLFELLAQMDTEQESQDQHAPDTQPETATINRSTS